MHPGQGADVKDGTRELPPGESEDLGVDYDDNSAPLKSVESISNDSRPSVAPRAAPNAPPAAESASPDYFGVNSITVYL